jgi:hypothetical protein
MLDRKISLTETRILRHPVVTADKILTHLRTSACNNHPSRIEALYIKLERFHSEVPKPEMSPVAHYFDRCVPAG